MDMYIHIHTMTPEDHGEWCARENDGAYAHSYMYIYIDMHIYAHI